MQCSAHAVCVQHDQLLIATCTYAAHKSTEYAAILLVYVEKLGSALHDGYSIFIEGCVLGWLRLALSRLHDRVAQHLELCQQPCAHADMSCAPQQDVFSLHSDKRLCKA